MPLQLSGTSGVLDNSGAFIAGTAVASTSGTSVTFTGIPSWVKRVSVILSGVSTNGTSPFIIRLGTSGGLLTSGYLGAVTNLNNGSTVGGNTTTGIGLQTAVGAASVFHSLTTITNISGNTWVASGVGGFSDGPTTTSTGCTVPLSGALTQVSVLAANGTDTFDAGTINILYE